MNELQEKIRCRECELVQWSDREKCRRCGALLPRPIVKIVEHVIERIVLRDSGNVTPFSKSTFDGANESELISSQVSNQAVIEDHFPTMAEMERTMILAAYRRSNRRPSEAARLLGIGKTTVYRKLREMKPAA